jgi:hypothetical protein
LGWQFEGQPLAPNTAVPHGYWFHISISGKVPNGFVVFDFSTVMSQVFGSPLAITIMVIRGKKNAIGETELATS